jgi:hypothetical protein
MFEYDLYLLYIYTYIYYRFLYIILYICERRGGDDERRRGVEAKRTRVGEDDVMWRHIGQINFPTLQVHPG